MQPAAQGAQLPFVQNGRRQWSPGSVLVSRETISKQWPFSAKSTPYAARAYCGRRSRSRTLGRLS
jgi:hypothetical protein